MIVDISLSDARFASDQGFITSLQVCVSRFWRHFRGQRSFPKRTIVEHRHLKIFGSIWWKTLIIIWKLHEGTNPLINTYLMKILLCLRIEGNKGEGIFYSSPGDSIISGMRFFLFFEVSLWPLSSDNSIAWCSLLLISHALKVIHNTTLLVTWTTYLCMMVMWARNITTYVSSLITSQTMGKCLKMFWWISFLEL